MTVEPTLKRQHAGSWNSTRSTTTTWRSCTDMRSGCAGRSATRAGPHAGGMDNVRRPRAKSVLARSTSPADRGDPHSPCRHVARPAAKSLVGLEWSSARQSDADDSVTRKQVVDRVIELDDDDRLVLMLRYVDAMEVDEIAATLSDDHGHLFAPGAHAARQPSTPMASASRARNRERCTKTLRSNRPPRSRSISADDCTLDCSTSAPWTCLPPSMTTETSIRPRAAHRAPNEERSGTRRLLLASALALVGAIGAGALVAGVVDDDSDTASPAVGQPTTRRRTRRRRALPRDERRAGRSIDVAVRLGCGHSRVTPVGSVLPITLDGAVAARLPACRPFAATVFESDRRPAAVQDARFISREASGNLMLQYVAVLESAQQATAMVDGIRDPAFLADCVPAYRATNPAECCPQQRFPSISARISHLRP